MVSSLRRPMSQVTCNGVTLTACLSWRVDQSIHFSADTFEVELAVAALTQPYDLNWLLSQSEMVIEIQAGVSSLRQLETGGAQGSLISLIKGPVDSLSFDPQTGLIELSGRDLSARFLDQRIDIGLRNLNAADVLTELAAKHGLQAKITAPSEPVGLFYNIDWNRLSGRRTEWDLICGLAQECDALVFMTGETLVFTPKPRAGDAQAFPVAYGSSSDLGQGASVLDLSFQKSTRYGAGGTVEVASWNARRKQAYRSISTYGAPGSVASSYRLTTPGLTQDQVAQFAATVAKGLAEQAASLQVRLPADLALDPRGLIALTGVNPLVDGLYQCAATSWSLSREEGFLMTLDARSLAQEVAA